MSSYLIVLSFLYFLQGLPYGLQSRFLPTYFRSQGMSLTNLGLFKLLLVPWMLKTLWAPLIDRHGTKATWLLWSMVGLVITCFVGAHSNPEDLFQVAMVLLLLNFLTSTQDIAVDGIAIELLSSSELGYGNIAQVVGYKFGAIFGGGLLTWIGDYLDWMIVFESLAVVYLLGVLVIWASLQKSENKKYHQNINISEQTIESGSWWRNHISVVFKTDGTWWIIIYVLLYKLGEQGALSMTPLFLIDNGVSASRVGIWIGIVGQVTSIIGSIVGGYVISYFRCSIIPSLKLTNYLRIILLLCQCVLVWFWLNIERWLGTDINLALAVFITSAMLFISGTMTTLTFTLMMDCSKRAPSSVQATHYTTLATCEVVGKLSFSVVTGILADYFGYKLIYLLFLVLSTAVVPLLSVYIPHNIVTNEHSN